MIIPAIGQVVGGSTTNVTSNQTASNAFGLSFEDLLRIILTQLTYQDPLKPMENFEFVSQLAQFSQIQLAQTANDRLLGLLQGTASSQAAALLGRVVDFRSGNATLSGEVKAVTFTDGEPRVTVETPTQQTISNISLTTITRIAEN